jgi:hypothetical protein
MNKLVPNLYWAQFFYSYIYVPVANSVYFYTSCLVIIVLLERISYFNAKDKKLFRLSAYKISTIVLLTYVSINSPYFFAFSPTSKTVKLDPETYFTIWFLNISEFANTQIGKAITIAVISIRDRLVLLIEIIMNVVSIYLFKQHMKKKMRIQRPSHMSQMAASSAASLSSNQRKRSVLMSNRELNLNICRFRLGDLSLDTCGPAKYSYSEGEKSKKNGFFFFFFLTFFWFFAKSIF